MLQVTIYFAVVVVAVLFLGFNIYRLIKSSTTASTRSKGEDSNQ